MASGVLVFDGDPKRSVAVRQAGIAHGPPAGDRDRVEPQVQLGGQVERHPLGPLGLDHDLVLSEDHVDLVPGHHRPFLVASQRHLHGPAVTTVHSPDSSSGTSGSGQRGSSR